MKIKLRNDVLEDIKKVVNNVAVLEYTLVLDKSDNPGNDLLVLILRYILCLVFLPLAVFDKGCGIMLIVFLLTLAGWIPGTIMTLLICIKDNNYYIKTK